MDAIVQQSCCAQDTPTKTQIRPEINDFDPDLDLKLGHTQPKISCTIPTSRHTTIPKDSGPISACFKDDSKLFYSVLTTLGLGLEGIPFDIFSAIEFPGGSGGAERPQKEKGKAKGGQDTVR